MIRPYVVCLTLWEISPRFLGSTATPHRGQSATTGFRCRAATNIVLKILRLAQASGDARQIYLALHQMASMHGPEQEAFARQMIEAAERLGPDELMLAWRQAASNPNQIDPQETILLTVCWM